MTPRKRGLIVLAVFATPAIAFFAWQAHEENKRDEEDRQIMIDRRLNVVNRINDILEQRVVSLGGANSDVLIVAGDTCNPTTLMEFASIETVASRVMNPDNGFRELQCRANPTRISVPRR